MTGAHELPVDDSDQVVDDERVTTVRLSPWLGCLLGGLLSAFVVASPIVDDGVRPSEALAIAGAFLTGTGLTAVRPGRRDGQ